MSCIKHKKDGNPNDLTYPDEQCLNCCEKHFCQAWDLAKEGGYITVNRQRIIGALASAQAHCFQSHFDFAKKLRDLRHKIQERKEEELGNDWERLATELDGIIEKRGRN